MNARYVLLTTNRFNLSKVQPHFINPCCFGEDFAAWLRLQLSARGINSFDPYQEDWGWEFQVRFNDDYYYVGLTGNSDDGVSDLGEWRVFVEKRPTIQERINGRAKTASDDIVLTTVEAIFQAQRDFKDVRREKE